MTLNKHTTILSMAFAAIMSFGTMQTDAQSLSPSTKWQWDKGKIVIESPERPAGQKDVLQLDCTCGLRRSGYARTKCCG